MPQRMISRKLIVIIFDVKLIDNDTADKRLKHSETMKLPYLIRYKKFAPSHELP